ncbi:MAG: hypothetical protein JO345_16185 [Streptosporangiaceae bacterium]|nr:hypothetical protein [Streptosporangiaceae bacterium]
MTAVRPEVADCAELARTTARSAGLAAGLRVIVGAGLPVPCSRNGITLVPAGCLGDVRGWQLGGIIVPHGSVTASARSHPLAATEGLEMVRVATTGLDHRPAPGDRTGQQAASDIAVLLLAIRLGLVARMLARATKHLSGRQADGQRLVELQLMRGAIADAAAALEAGADELCAVLASPAAEAPVVHGMHARLDRVDWSVITMFGASGYLREHDVRCLYVGHLVHDAWVGPPPPDAPVQFEEP